MSQQDIVDRLIDTQGTLFSEEMGLDLRRDSAADHFGWLVGTTLLAARISSHNAMQAGRALNDQGFLDPNALLSGSLRDLVRCLNENGYARYDESTARYLRDAATMVRDRYQGDIRRMRDDAPDANTVLERLQQAKGIGKVGAGIYAREAQLVWDEFYPRLDGPAAKEAEALGLTTDHGALASMAGSCERFTRLAAALTRAALDGPDDTVEDAS